MRAMTEPPCTLATVGHGAPMCAFPPSLEYGFEYSYNLAGPSSTTAILDDAMMCDEPASISASHYSNIQGALSAPARSSSSPGYLRDADRLRRSYPYWRRSTSPSPSSSTSDLGHILPNSTSSRRRMRSSRGSVSPSPPSTPSLSAARLSHGLEASYTQLEREELRELRMQRSKIRAALNASRAQKDERQVKVQALRARRIAQRQVRAAERDLAREESICRGRSIDANVDGLAMYFAVVL